MADTRRDERFRWYVRRFLEEEGVEAGEVRSRTSGPRVVVEDAEGVTTEIRVAELLRPPEGGDRESVRAFRRSVVREAGRRWRERTGGPHVEVWVEFSGHEQTTAARDRTELAGTLCALVEDALPEPDGFARIVPDEPGHGADFPVAVSGLTVARLGDYTASSWHVAGSPPATGLDADAVRAVVRRASSEAEPEPGAESGGAEPAETAPPPDRRWLLVVADSFRLRGRPAIPEGVTGEAYESVFDRIVLFDPATAEATPLRTGRPDAGG